MKPILVSLIALKTLGIVSEAGYFRNSPLVICDRGSAGQFPQHSLAAQTDCYLQEADFIGVSLHPTKDNYLVVNELPILSIETNIDQFEWLFKNRKRNVTFPLYHQEFINEYFIVDFTLAELKMLNRKRTQSQRSTLLDSSFKILTFEETIENIYRLQFDYPKKRQFQTGFYIDLKNYWWYDQEYSINTAVILHDILVKEKIETVAKSSLKLPIILSSYEEVVLYKLQLAQDLPRVQKMSFQSNYDLQSISKIAHGISADLEYFYKDKSFYVPNDFVDFAHSFGLQVHAQTIKDDQLVLQDDVLTEYQTFLDMGVDGINTDFPHSAKMAINYFNKKTKKAPFVFKVKP